MIYLREEFGRNGAQYKQVYKNWLFAIYRIDKEFVNGEKGTWWEIFFITVKPRSEYVNDEYEKYPSDEDFGSWAWSCSTIPSLEKVLKREFPGFDEDYDEILQICSEGVA